jgi:hypothetical protein
MQRICPRRESIQSPPLASEREVGGERGEEERRGEERRGEERRGERYSEKE